MLRTTLGGGILLGLEVLVAADRVLPWRRALTTSGAQVVAAGAVARDRAATGSAGR